MIAQDALHHGHVDGASLPGQQLAGSLESPFGDAPRDVGVSVGGGHVEATLAVPPAFAPCKGIDVARRDLPVVADGDVIRVGVQDTQTVTLASV